MGVTDYFKGRVPCGSWGYWLLVLAIIPVVLMVTLVARRYLLDKRARRKVGCPSISCCSYFQCCCHRNVEFLVHQVQESEFLLYKLVSSNMA